MGLGVGRVSLSSACEHLGCGHVPAALRLPSQQGRERREEDAPDLCISLSTVMEPWGWFLSNLYNAWLGGMVGAGLTARQPLSS